jgi:hypothetical protein
MTKSKLKVISLFGLIAIRLFNSSTYTNKDSDKTSIVYTDKLQVDKTDVKTRTIYKLEPTLVQSPATSLTSDPYLIYQIKRKQERTRSLTKCQIGLNVHHF